ncbi:MAG: biopolymer transporter ExbD [Pseudomonadota bacterium]
MRRKPSHQAESADVNITPLLDIVFIMLIFFIVTATFVREFGIDVSRPNDQQEDPPEGASKIILIDIDQQDNIFINKRPVDRRAVRANVERFLAESPESSVLISAAPTAKNGLAVEVLDQAKRAGAGNVSISVQQVAQ